MNAADRAQFDSTLIELHAALDLRCPPEKLDAFWQALQELTLPELARIRDLVLRDLREDGESPRRFTVGDVWRHRKRLRAAGPLRAPSPQEPAPDPWDIKGNDHLRGHLAKRFAENPRYYGEPATVQGMRASTEPNADASPEFVHAIGCLVDAKKAWAQDMRDMAKSLGGEVPVKEQRAVWDDLIGEAERKIAAPAQERAA